MQGFLPLPYRLLIKNHSEVGSILNLILEYKLSVLLPFYYYSAYRTYYGFSTSPIVLLAFKFLQGGSKTVDRGWRINYSSTRLTLS
jgi:hypothetical protein